MERRLRGVRTSVATSDPDGVSGPTSPFGYYESHSREWSSRLHAASTRPVPTWDTPCGCYGSGVATAFDPAVQKASR